MCRKLRAIKNRMLLRLGVTMVNAHGYTVHLYKGRQVKSNPRRIKDYSMDDEGWRILRRA